LCGIEIPTDENVIVGLERADDAGVYRVSESLALIQTVDFFTPIVDDPHAFGEIAAANALSDVYAMGGIPKTAMNLVAFPAKEMDLSILRRIITGGIAKLREAGVVLLGGHTIEDRELKYGLSVTGFVHPDRVLTKRNLKPGDRLVLTKPLGTGIVNTAIKAGMASLELTDRVIGVMSRLNRSSAAVMERFPVHACTDVTGFGLLGHLAEMVEGSGAGVRLSSADIPAFPEALAFAEMGLIPAGAYRNRDFREPMIDFADAVPRSVRDLLFDPQTSGGLLISVSGDRAADLVEALRAEGGDDAAVIGDVIPGPAERIHVLV
jgi:selenide,water dikinase